MIPLRIVVTGLAILYALFKESESAEKDQQIEILQENNLKMKEEIKKLQEGLKDLLCKYETLKIWVFKNLIVLNDVDAKDKTFKLWLLDDYLSVSRKKIKGEELTEEERKFLSIVEKKIESMGQVPGQPGQLPNVDLTEQEKDFIKDFVYSRHKVKIQVGEEPDVEAKLQKIEEELKKGLERGES